MSRKKDDEAAVALARRVATGPIEARREAAASLRARSAEMHDIRAAQPALAFAMLDPDVTLRRLAVRATSERVESAGCDVRLAFPALMRAVQDEDAEVRGTAWVIVSMADARHDEPRRAFLELALAAGSDPDPTTREWSARAIAKMRR